MNGVDEYNIFWVEWQDANTVTMGVNGKETIKITKEEVEGKDYTWPFDLTFNPEGCYFLLTMMYLGKDAPDATGYEGITHDQARLPEHNAKNSVIPRMEIDWVRFYVDDSYLSTVGNYKFNNSIFY